MEQRNQVLRSLRLSEKERTREVRLFIDMKCDYETLPHCWLLQIQSVVDQHHVSTPPGTAAGDVVIPLMAMSEDQRTADALRSPIDSSLLPAIDGDDETTSLTVY